VPASDLAEGMLNNSDRPPVHGKGKSDGNNAELYAGQPLPHFNEVDECAGVDALVTNLCWKALGLDPSTTLHDVRWGEHYKGAGSNGSGDIDAFVWLLQISGAAPANHFVGGYAGAVCERQPAMYFPLGGGSLKGVGKPGEIVWSRVFVEGGSLHADLGRGTVVSLPAAETERRWRQTTIQWPIVHAILHGVSQNQMMARHRANHVNIAYASSSDLADKALATKAAMLAELGVHVHLCGVTQ
jgi:predicted XRE-type DNA-binding protein